MSEQTIAKLRNAAQTGEPTRIDRTPKYATRLCGFVLEVGDKWAVIQKYSDGGYFDGYVLIRVRDVSKVRPDSSFEGRFARTQPEYPPSADFSLDLSDTRAALVGIAAQFPLIAIEKERKREAMWIGEVEEVAKGRLWLVGVGPDAVWDEEPLGYRLRSITTIAAGGRYFTALAKIAGPSERRGALGRANKSPDAS